MLLKKTLILMIILGLFAQIPIYAQAKPLSEEEKQFILKLQLNEKILSYFTKLYPSPILEELLDSNKKKRVAKNQLDAGPVIPYYALPLNIIPASSKYVSVIPNFYIAEIDDWYLSNGVDTFPIPFGETFRREDKKYKIFYNPDEFGGMPQIFSGQAMLSPATFLIEKYSLESAIRYRLYRFGSDKFFSSNSYYDKIYSTKIDTLGLEWVSKRHVADSSAQIFFCLESNLSKSPVIVIATKTIEDGQPCLGDIKLIYYEYSWEVEKEGIFIEYPDGTKFKTPDEMEVVFDEIVIPIVAKPDTYEEIAIRKQRVSEEDFLKFRTFIMRYDKAK